MGSRILSVLVFFLLLVSRAAFAQAAAESVLLNGNSATATTQTGTKLGQAFNKAANKVSGQVQPATSSGVVVEIHRVPRSKTSTWTTTKPTTGPMITSVQGGRVTSRPATTTPASAPASAPASK